MPDYDVEVELIDGHTMTVRVEDGPIDGSYVALTIGDRLVARAHARVAAPACRKCWNSGIERGPGIKFGPGHEPMRRLICDCPHGVELLRSCGPDGFTEDPTQAKDGGY